MANAHLNSGSTHNNQQCSQFIFRFVMLCIVLSVIHTARDMQLTWLQLIKTSTVLVLVMIALFMIIESCHFSITQLLNRYDRNQSVHCILFILLLFSFLFTWDSESLSCFCSLLQSAHKTRRQGITIQMQTKTVTCVWLCE